MKDKLTILVIEDHEDIQEVLRFNLEKEGFDVTIASDGAVGLKLARSAEPDLILLDLMLPKVDGLEVCRQLKADKSTQDIQMIMLTAKGEESDIVAGLTLGADDYVVKPFSPKEVIARVRAVLRRVQTQPKTEIETVLKADDLTMNLTKHEVRMGLDPVELTLAEFNLLKTLIAGRGRVFTRDQLIEKMRGPGITIIDRNIDVHVASLRKKLGQMSESILTVRGVGYRFQD